MAETTLNRICRNCGETKNLEGGFNRRSDGKRPYKWHCRECEAKRSKIWYNKQDDKTYNEIRIKSLSYYHQNKKIVHAKTRAYRARVKQIIYNHYGDKCSCPKCPDTKPGQLFLTIDHINNDGFKNKITGNYGISYRIGSTNLYLKIIKDNFPDTYQVLCWNCNCGKRMNNGVCPHLT